MFFTFKVRNESGDGTAFERDKNGSINQIFDEYGAPVSFEGMIMPDGTKLNRGNGFDYQKMSMGFYFDADVLTTDITGNPSGVHTNSDDRMQYIDCLYPGFTDLFPDGCPTFQGEPMRISMAVVGDDDGESVNPLGYSMETGEQLGNDFGVVAVQMLDTPYANDYIDLNHDGIPDIYPGQKLKMTDWHWFDWFDRPGALSSSGSSAPALNKELIQYQVMAGDNTNLTDAEKWRFFHTSNPDTDLDSELNPHFDSLEGLGTMDCLSIMSSGPFDLKVGEQVSFSFTVIYGNSLIDLVENAKNAQILYNKHYSSG